NNSSSISENGESTSSILSKSEIKFVKAADSSTVIKINKDETVRKPSVKYAEMYRKTSKSSNVRGNQRNWNNLKSQQLGKNFLMKNKACFNCGDFDHLAYDCGNSQNVIDDKGYWDSGCSRHMTGNISYLSEYEPYDGGYVSFGQGGCKITNRGTIKTGKLEFENVYFVKDLKYNMFSVSQICDNKNSVLFIDSKCIVLGREFKLRDDTNVLLRTPRQHNMYSIDLNNIVPYKDLTCLVAKASADKSELWHRRLGHLNFKTMNRLVRHNLVKGLPSKCFDNDHTCVACLKEKKHKASCKTKLVNSVTKPLHTLHMDLFRPTSVSSLNHKWYCLVVTDDFSRFTWTFFLKTKDETSGILRNFITEIENLKDLKVKLIRCDNGGEFRNKEINDFCSRKGIKREFRNAKTPQQNGVVEWRNRTLIEAAKTMVLVNKSQNKTPYELFNGRTPAIGFLKPFGYHVMILNTLDNLGNFDAKGDEDFLENKDIEKGAGPNWLFDIDSLTNSMNYVLVVVAGTNSTNFSGTKEAAGQDMKNDVSSLRYIALPNWFHEAHLESSTSNAQDTCNTDAPESSGNSNPTATSTNPLADNMETLVVETLIHTDSSLVPTACLNDSPEPSSDIRLISKRVTSQDDTPSLDNILTLTNRFEDILGVTTNTDDSNRVETDLGNMENNISASPAPTFRIHKDHPKSPIIGHVDTQFKPEPKPTKIYDVLHDPSWVEAMQEELLQFKIQNVWSLVDCPKREEGIDYDEVLAPVARIEAIRLFLAYASFMGFTVYQMDVKSVFLCGTIDEEVYVMQPPGFQDPEFPARVYKVDKAMYELHQASRAWYGTLSKYLLKNGFQRVLQKNDGIFLSQDKYVRDILKKFRYSDVRSSNTPMDKENLWGKDGTEKDVDLHLYRSMIGSLMYLTASRPDIMFAVCACARHQVTPKECHLHAVKMIFRYLKGHPKLGLWYPKESPFNLVAYSDSDYGGDSHGVEVDLSNMENNISASPTPTLIIYNDHPTSQIIGPVDTLVQTRTKSKEMEGQSFIASIHYMTNPDLLQFHLFSCFLSHEDPKKISDALKDPSWVEAMKEELLNSKSRMFRVWLIVLKGLSDGYEECLFYGTIDEEVYVMQPPRFQDPEFPARVYKVEKAMYGLHQALRAWYGTLSKYLLTNGFQR
nr:hypothetical protein [Tanacetum cinerariifolium]